MDNLISLSDYKEKKEREREKNLWYQPIRIPGIQNVCELDLPKGAHCVNLTSCGNKLFAVFLIPERGNVIYHIDPTTGEVKEVVI